MHFTASQRLLLRVTALIGLLGPNGVFLYYAFFRWSELVAALRHPVTLAFVAEAMLVLVLLAILLAAKPLGRWGWKSFVILSLVGGLGFGIPAILLLNSKD